VDKWKTPLTVAEILRWADAHKQHTGSWPTKASGPVWGAPGVTWQAVQSALRRGCRGLPGGDTLAGLLRRARGVGERRGRPPVWPCQARQVMRLRARGLSLAEVGREMGVSKQRVHQLLQQVVALRDQQPLASGASAGENGAAHGPDGGR
jgi:hypothetical protein